MTENNFLKFFTPLKSGQSMKATMAIPLFPFDVGTMMEMQRRNLKALATAQQLTLESLQVIAHRQGAMIGDLASEQASLLREAMQTGEPADKVAEQTLILQSFYERLVDHAREINDMLTQSSHETADVLHQRVGSSLNELRDAIARAKDRKRAA